ncbi:MAG: Z1 domain-containing protein [Porphyromonas pasteri]
MQEEELGRAYQSSALIHCDIAQKLHKWQSELIESVITGVCSAICSRPQEDRMDDTIRKIYSDFEQSNKKARAQGLINVKLPSRTAVIKRMQQIFEREDYRIYVVNSQNDVPNMLDDSGQLKLSCTANIFVGGSILDRGITIGKMICFFYGRDPKRFQMDTVLQHARMFGARDKEDMAVTRFHTTPAIYQVFSHMNEIDDQLRETLISWEAESGDAPLEAIFVGYDKVIKPCASQKIKVADTLVLKSHYRLYPRGFQTGRKTKIGRTILRIDQLLKENFKPIGKKDFGKLPKNIALEIIDLIRSTYLYEERYNNLAYIWNEQDMKGAIEYASSQSGEDYIYCLHRTNRSIGRYRENGNFTNSPDTGSIDLKPSRELAKTIPVLMLLRQNGDEAQGWNGSPFYWPVLVLPQELPPAIFTYGAKEAKLLPQREQVYERDLMKGVKEKIKEEEILRLTLNSELFYDIILGEKNVECREITENTASRYLIADPKNSFGYKLIDGIAPEQVKAGIFDQVDDQFPFDIKPYRYLLFRNSRDSSGSLLLIELDESIPYHFEYETVLEEDILLHPDFREVEQVDELRRWAICYHIKRVVSTLLTKADEGQLNRYREQLEEDGWVYEEDDEQGEIEARNTQVSLPTGRSPKEQKPKSTRKSHFRFSMVGIDPGEYLTFVPTSTQVLVVDDSTIGYMGDDYKLSGFAGKYMPSELRNPSDVYQGVRYFTYKGKLLCDLRAEAEKKAGRK